MMKKNNVVFSYSRIKSEQDFFIRILFELEKSRRIQALMPILCENCPKWYQKVQFLTYFCMFFGSGGLMFRLRDMKMVAWNPLVKAVVLMCSMPIL